MKFSNPTLIVPEITYRLSSRFSETVIEVIIHQARSKPCAAHNCIHLANSDNSSHFRLRFSPFYEVTTVTSGSVL